MADTKPKSPSSAAKPSRAAKSAATASKDEKKRGKPRNYDLGNGVYRFSRARMYHKKALYKFVGKKNEKKVKPKKPTHVEKPIGGEKNGGKRIVLIKKRRNFYPTADRIKKRPSKKLFKQHKRYTRKSLTPGTICILLAGPHKGKRVVLLKVLKSGLLLVNGPFKINGCPLRRVSQNYVIATSTKLDFSGVQLPEHINDEYFKRNRQKRAKKEEGDLFATKKPQYKPSEQRKTDQKLVDKLVNGAIRKHPDKRHLFAYLSAMFGLRSSQYPHRLQF
ncbi:60S ribosomal protein L6 [Schistocerca cancellata]|uniref:60S ribosomal protein L6 n=1 Tax=Schistocerca cancellata TaxID=274614 RepID=UPI002118EA2C|nr:60S ribosomal protein L6 [Schistocerca cancellata]XP_049767354.1 60S ribosomal protein L6 [Schistocerca cancellata]XP_049767355.1 60S ribosomal protein L6 [Schistocerca cancellata]